MLFLEPMQAYTKILFLVFCFICLTLVAATYAVRAETISNSTIINAKISKMAPVSYEELETLFKHEPIYKVECFTDKSKEVVPRPEPQQVLGSLWNEDEDGEVSFKFQPLEEGFNITAVKRTATHSENSLFNFEKEVACAIGDDKEGPSGACSSLNFTHEAEFESRAKAGNEDYPAEDYAPKGEKSEQWAIYVASPKLLYATKTSSVTQGKLDMWNRESSSIQIDKFWVCTLKLKSFSVDL